MGFVLRSSQPFFKGFISAPQRDHKQPQDIDSSVYISVMLSVALRTGPLSIIKRKFFSFEPTTCTMSTKWAKGRPSEDDVTLVVIKVKQPDDEASES